MPLFRRVHGPTVFDSFLLCAVSGNRVARQFKADEVRHHAATGKVPSSLVVVAGHVGEPAHGPPLHRYRRGANRVGSNVLVESGANEITDDSDGIGRRGDPPHVAGMADMGAIW